MPNLATKGQQIVGTLRVKNAVIPNKQIASADGAITIKDGVVVITKAGVAALTLADPTATVDDYKTLTIVSVTAAAHTVTNTTGFNAGGAGSDVATYSAAKGACLVLVAYHGVWYTRSLTSVTLA